MTSVRLCPLLVLLAIGVGACAGRGDLGRPVVTHPTSAASPAKARPDASANAPARATPKASPPPAVQKKRDVRVAIADPSREQSRTLRVRRGDAVSLTLPETAGSAWSVERGSPVLGAPSEEVEAKPAAAAHEYGVTFTWPVIGAPAGTYVVDLALKSASPDAVAPRFQLTLEVERASND